MSVVEVLASLLHVNHVAIRLCCGLCRVKSWCPANGNFVRFLIGLGTYASHRQGLNHDTFAAVTGGDEANHCLVNGTRHEELEVGVVSEAHVCPVLVAQHLEDDGRHLRVACLAIVPVVKVSSVPEAQFPRQIICDLCHHHISQVATDKP